MTAVRRAGPGRVVLELDGRLWRIVPDEVVLRLGFAAGDELDRGTLRRLRAELRRVEAFAAAGRSLSRRDLSKARLRERLRRAGVAPAEKERTLARLERMGLVDDHRLARARAATLAERGWGDAAIAARLEEDGIDASTGRAVIDELAPERERALALAGGECDRRKAGSLLIRRGFSPDSIEAAVGMLDEGLPTQLG